MRRIAVVDAPTNLGLRPPTASSVPGCAKAPGSLRDSGLLARLGARDAGCITPPRYDPAGWQPGDGVAQAEEIAVFVRRLADRIGTILASGDFPVVLGGDCSILLGAGLAMRRYSADLAGRVGLVYVDGHSDFRHEGNASYVGAAAGEALALATGRGQSNLASIEQRRPYFRDVDVVLLGIRTHDEYRLDLQAAGIVARAVPELRSHGAARSAQWARDQLRECAGFWVHVDVDVLDPAVMPAVDAPDVGGIAYRELEILLSGLVCDPRCVGVQVTVFDPDYDPDGQYAREVTDVLVAGLEPLVTSSALAAADLTPVVSAPPLQAPAPPAVPAPAPPARVPAPPAAPRPAPMTPAPAAAFAPAQAFTEAFADERITAWAPADAPGRATHDGADVHAGVTVDAHADLDVGWAAEPVSAAPTGSDTGPTHATGVAVETEGAPAANLSGAPVDDPDDDLTAGLYDDLSGDDLPEDDLPTGLSEDRPAGDGLRAGQSGHDLPGADLPDEGRLGDNLPGDGRLGDNLADGDLGGDLVGDGLPENVGGDDLGGDLADDPLDDLGDDLGDDLDDGRSGEAVVQVEPASPNSGGALVTALPAGADGPGDADLDLPPVAWVDVRTGAVVDLAADRGAGRAATGRGEAPGTPRLPAYSRGAVIGITTRRPIDLDAVEPSADVTDGGWVTLGSGGGPDGPGEPESGPDRVAEQGAEDGGGALPFGRAGRKGRRAPRLALTLAPISAPPSSGRLARRADPLNDDDDAPARDREGVVPFVPAQSRTPREHVEPPESPLTDVVPAARTPDEEHTPKQR